MPRQPPPLSDERVELINGRVLLFKKGKLLMEIAKGKKFAGSIVHASGRWATCPACERRHAIGARCVCNGKGKREHRDQKKPDNIKGE